MVLRPQHIKFTKNKNIHQILKFKKYLKHFEKYVKYKFSFGFPSQGHTGIIGVPAITGGLAGHAAAGMRELMNWGRQAVAGMSPTVGGSAVNAVQES